MTPAEQSALEGLAGRPLTTEELAVLPALVEIRNDVATAALLSVDRVKHGPTQIGPGTIVAVLGEDGGVFLDDLQDLGEADRNVYWTMNPLNRGVFDLQVKAARDSLLGLKLKLPVHADNIDKILEIGIVPDPIPFDQVSRALNKAQGLMTL